jgi:pyruvate/2-oxoglutarate dehydrogenase complex dihydrolipoamide dehydrogenase (E3) component
MGRLRRLRAGIAPHDSASRFSGLGVDVFLGDARFVAPDAVEVGGERVTFSRAILACGARAAAPPVPGLDEAGYLTNETVFSLTERPARLLVVGAGPIGCEMAQAFARLGSHVTMVSLDRQLLPREDADTGRLLAAVFEREGVELRLGASLTRAARTDTGRHVVVVRDGVEETIEADEILVAVGRAPNVEGLGLETAGIAVTRAGVTVDDFLRTSNPRVYAAGDICTPYKFTHAADAMARIAIQNALFFGRKRASALVIPWATYTSPEVAHVGMSAADAERAGDRVVTLQVDLDEVDRAVLDGDTDGFARAHVEARSGRLLGATVVSRHAGDLIGEFSLAMTAGLKMDALSRTIHPYPTVGGLAKALGDAWMRRRLTPRVKRLLSTVLTWRR